MGDKSKISWTDASWNPSTGCSRVSPGCENCYAEALSLRMGWSKKPWKAQFAAENVVLHPERLDLPRKWKRPRRIFVNSMSDLFHEQIPDEFIDQVFDVMEHERRHVYQVLTKRPERMRGYMKARALHQAVFVKEYTMNCRSDETMQRDAERLYIRDNPHIWLGTSVEDQRRADERIPVLLQTPTAVRFLSMEPLLGEVSILRYIVAECGGCGGCGGDCCAGYGWVEADDLIHWVIVGGESGKGYRPMELWWAEAIRDHCLEAHVPFFFKQVSAFMSGQGEDALGQVYHEFPEVA